MMLLLYFCFVCAVLSPLLLFCFPFLFVQIEEPLQTNKQKIKLPLATGTFQKICERPGVIRGSLGRRSGILRESFRGRSGSFGDSFGDRSGVVQALFGGGSAVIPQSCRVRSKAFRIFFVFEKLEIYCLRNL